MNWTKRLPVRRERWSPATSLGEVVKGFVRGPPVATWTQLYGMGKAGARKTDADLIGKRAVALMTVPGDGVCQFSDNRCFFATEVDPGWMYGRQGAY